MLTTKVDHRQHASFDTEHPICLRRELTPVGLAFQLYAEHSGGTLVELLDDPTADATYDVVATIGEDGAFVATFCGLDAVGWNETVANLSLPRGGEGTITTLRASGYGPDSVFLAAEASDVTVGAGGGVRVVVPPLSIVQLRLAAFLVD